MKSIRFPLRPGPILGSVAASLILSVGACGGLRENETAHPLPGRLPGSESATPITRDSVPSGLSPGKLAE